MEENRTGQTAKESLLAGLIFVIAICAAGVSGYVFRKNMADVIRNGIVSSIGMGILLFVRSSCRNFGEYAYDNEAHGCRFWICFMAGLALAVTCAGLPLAGWPYVAVFVLLSLYSNTLIGMTSASMLLILTLLLANGPAGTFVLYFMSGMTGAVVFRKLDENYRIGQPMVITLAILLVCETANEVIYRKEGLSFEIFLIPLMNVAVTGILLMIILKLFSVTVIYRYRDKYMEINDQECRLLVELKQHSKEEYYKAVHIAYFCDRIAHQLHMDVDAAKAGGYYCRIGSICGTKMWEDVFRICQECEFPPKVQEILQEVLDRRKPLVSKEAAVVLCSDAVISSILYLLSKKGDAPLDYEKVIDTVFRKKLESGVFDHCVMSVSEMNQMKKIFKKEKLYYDFLR